MKKILLLVLVLLSIFLGYSFAKDKLVQKSLPEQKRAPKSQLLRFALVADSGDENDFLAKALDQAKGEGVNFVIGLGDWTTVGTIVQLQGAKKVFDDSGLVYYVTAGDHDLWDSRNGGEDALTNFRAVFGNPTKVFKKGEIQFVILDNSDIYLGMSDESVEISKKLKDSEPSTQNSAPTFVFSHKTPFHPQSAHIMGQQSAQVAAQAKEYIKLLEESKVDGFFSGDLHFFARFNSPNNAVRMTTIGAVASQRNFQGPRFAIVTVYSDYSWEVADVEIR